ncbi:MAG: hypothetical protein K6G42_06770 [Lachnospiraceae bacterium]|nr:hypothetical protein [Lachnospiraceae bacterium]
MKTTRLTISPRKVTINNGAGTGTMLNRINENEAKALRVFIPEASFSFLTGSDDGEWDPGEKRMKHIKDKVTEA